MQQVGATDDPDELVVTQYRQAFDAATFHQLDDVAQRRVLPDGMNRPGHHVLDLAAACADVFLGQPPRTDEKFHAARPLPLRTGLGTPEKISLRHDPDDVTVAIYNRQAADPVLKHQVRG